MEYVIANLQLNDTYGCFTADSGKGALEQWAVANGCDNLMEFASAKPQLAGHVLAIQLQ